MKESDLQDLAEMADKIADSFAPGNSGEITVARVHVLKLVETWDQEIAQNPTKQLDCAILTSNLEKTRRIAARLAHGQSASRKTSVPSSGGGEQRGGNSV